MLSYFVKHRLAANILMVMMIVAGFLAMKKTPVTLVPNVSAPNASFSVSYEGASAQIVANDIAYPLSELIKQESSVDNVYVDVNNGGSYFSIKFDLDANVEKALPKVQTIINQFNWPSDVDVPNAVQEQWVEPVGFYILDVEGDINTLRQIALDAKTQLVAKGIADVGFWGLNSTDIYWKPELQDWLSLNVTPRELVQQLNEQFGRRSGGVVGRQSLVVGSDLKHSRDIANLTINQTPLSMIHDLEDLSDSDPVILVDGKPAVILIVNRSAEMGALESGEIVHKWMQEFNEFHGDAVNVTTFFDFSNFVQSFLDLLSKNAIVGLMLVLLTLFVLLNGRVAVWTAVGIPVAILGMFGLLYIIEGNINIYTILALLIALGIVVDDAIVISEETLSLKQKGYSASEAAIHGVKRMFAPVTAAALTSIAAFAPLLFLPGVIGETLKAVPIVIICVLIASLFECFFVLPGHLNHSLSKNKKNKESKLRLAVDSRFEKIRDGGFRKLIKLAALNRWNTILIATSIFILSIAMLSTGVVKFEVDMDVEFDITELSVDFYDDVSKENQEEYTEYLLENLKAFEKKNPNLIQRHFYQKETQRNRLVFNLGLYEADKRADGLSNVQILDKWKATIAPNAWVEEIRTSEDPSATGSGGGSSIVRFRMESDNLEDLELAVSDAKNAFSKIEYLDDVNDSFRSGVLELEVKANLLAQQLGMDEQYILSQANSWLSSNKVLDISRAGVNSAFYLGVDKDESNGLDQLNRLPIKSPNGDIYTLEQLTVQSRQIAVSGFSISNGMVSAQINARILDESLNVSDVSNFLNQTIITPIEIQYGIESQITGSAQETNELFVSFIVSAVVAMLLIFLILAWLFQSWVWPMAVVVAIPFSLTGSILGHFFMGVPFTPLSILGLFGVMGIVVNDSIILIDRFRQLLESGMDKIEAIVEASCQRFRAVLLTSITTVIGLIPLLFESSIQAQIIKTMAISLAFGLLYGTLVVLVITPCVVSFMRTKHLGAQDDDQLKESSAAKYEGENTF